MNSRWSALRRIGADASKQLSIALAGAFVALALVDWYHDAKLARLREWRPGVMVCGNDRLAAQMYGAPSGALVLVFIVEYVSSRRRRSDK